MSALSDSLSVPLLIHHLSLSFHFSLLSTLHFQSLPSHLPSWLSDAFPLVSQSFIFSPHPLSLSFLSCSDFGTTFNPKWNIVIKAKLYISLQSNACLLSVFYILVVICKHLYIYACPLVCMYVCVRCKSDCVCTSTELISQMYTHLCIYLSDGFIFVSLSVCVCVCSLSLYPSGGCNLKAH